MQLIVVGLLVQMLLFLSVFDIYFKSPIMHGIPTINNNVPAPAKRLVLFVADGLRADKFFELSTNKTPYLRSIIETRGVWGVSKTRVPTESRPGHVALIAGLYEDPSAIFKGWKDNPVEFDSVFNQSSQTFCWGSPDILPMFRKGAARGHVHVDMYSPYDQEFFGANQNPSELNIWVIKKFKSFFNNSKHGSLPSDVYQTKTIFFLHLLSTDIVGHANKPNSVEYEENISIVDKIVQEAEDIISQFYNDNATAFIFTSDHGMTDWGSHGSGTDSETETPIVAWGAGITRPKYTNDNTDTPSSWKLSQFVRHDINQSDVTPLMSALLGIPIPVHSVGVLPWRYLNLPENYLIQAFYLNAKQIMAQYTRKQKEVEESTLFILYKEYKAMNKQEQYMLCSKIEACIQNNNTNNVTISMVQSLIFHSLSGLEYYQNYYEGYMILCITLTFLGWASCIMCYLLINTPLNTGVTIKPDVRIMIAIDIFFGFLALVGFFLIFVQSLPVQFYLYLFLPLVLWWWMAQKVCQMLHILKTLMDNIYETILLSVLYTLATEALVLSFFHREILSGIMICIAFWPFMSPFKHKCSKNCIVSWGISCIGLAIFPCLPTVGFYENVLYVVTSGCLWIIGGIFLQIHPRTNELKTSLISTKILLIFIALANLVCLSCGLDNKGLLMATQITSWLLLGLSLIFVVYGPNEVYARFISIALSLAVPYLLLSVGHEAFFTLFLTINLICWIVLEYQLSDNEPNETFQELTIVYDIAHGKKPLTTQDLRRSFFFLFYIILSFFGIGNIASINSFDVSWVKAFITVFSPFVMTGLILLKTIIPFLIVTVAFRLINISMKVQTKQLFLIVLLLCDIMSLNFFYQITNKGSWLEIGMSISHYVIMQTTIMFLVCLYGFTKLLTDPFLPSCVKAHSLEEPDNEPPGFQPNISKSHLE